ncbi:hypothetical protein L9Z73_03525 [Pseudomonas sp. TNT11]|uniref:Uncharacterized protein n=1 Tax=Pseudomonas emilianonis TaxID=2915812 RepID=A0ABT0ECV8_9PSED|nr:hypothetical protein [Pseudomonas emilianonis]MCK1783464.1 hypothetical protein [Pseudomonas emilianonis]
MSKDGINVNQAPDDFYRPQIPPVAPPPANSSTVKPLRCRCGREAEWLLDGSLFGCNSCFVSGTSMTYWNDLVGTDPAVPEALSGYESWKSGYAEGWRVGSKVAVDERLQLKTENDALKAKRLARAARTKKLVGIASTHRRDALVLRKDLESHKRMLLAAACDLGAIGEALKSDMDADGDELLGMVIDLKAQNTRMLEWLKDISRTSGDKGAVMGARQLLKEFAE